MRGQETRAQPAKGAKPKPQPWPKELSKQAAAVAAALSNFGAAATAEEIAKHFGRATKQRVELVEELLETLATLGKARLVEGQKFISA